ncbi:MAG: bifunctional 4-hydroxy-2-oxoglutarate aldolase/2-dehydro-3-deoxy-phosphogluconate aldolase, partial [Chthoniobacterales bacterium]|nr:bifunctional 4-hydroxy-2-oxoglutarate aldolase/2-dehydro-3-deoxy-phosphogluconate aldolase [Chthoniobacterales bacterium]
AVGVFGVVVVEEGEIGVRVARALYEGGVRVVEFSLRGKGGLEALRRVRRELRNVILGAGTVLTVEQVLEVKEVGVDFAVSPGLSERVLGAAKEVGLSYAPGVATPGEIQRALEWGCKVMKFFPAEGLGGLRYLKMASGPFAGLGVHFLAMGGIGEDKLEDYLAEPLIAAVGGSWLVPSEFVKAEKWSEICSIAKRAREIVKKRRI